MKRDHLVKRSWQAYFAFIILLVGILLLTYMIIIEDEPGAVPLLMILTGAGWIARIRYQKKKLVPEQE